MTEKEIGREFKRGFKALFPGLKEAGIRLEPFIRNAERVDISLALSIGGKKKVLLCEIAAQSYPKQLREKGFQLLEIAGQGKKGYPVIIAPYISELGRDTCKKIGVGFLDLSGNAYLEFDSFYMEIEGKPNKFKTGRELAGLFSPKAERVLRYYLYMAWTKGGRVGNYRDIAKEASVSLGQITKVNRKLDELGFWIEESGEVKKLDSTKLLDLWRDNYRYDRNDIFSLYSIKQVPQIEKQIAEFCNKNKKRYAVTFFSGANRLAPFTRYNVATTYFSGNIEALKKSLDLKEVSSGANLQVLTPYDEGVYYKAGKADSIMVANPVQVYLDLYSYRGRGREQAEFLREKVIKF